MVATPAKAQGNYIDFRPLSPADAGQLSRMLKADPQEYTRHFHPFAFTEEAIREQITGARLDKFFAIELRATSGAGGELIGFYMLRGLDDGFDDPMYGVYISAAFSRKGIGRLTLKHAECCSRINGHRRILLKVHTDNINARNLYESEGYKPLKEDLASGMSFMQMDL